MFGPIRGTKAQGRMFVLFSPPTFGMMAWIWRRLVTGMIQRHFPEALDQQKGIPLAALGFGGL